MFQHKQRHRDEFQENDGLQDGHTILLMQTKEGERTFSDYPNQADCLMTIINLFEVERLATKERSSGDLEEFCHWVDAFSRLEMYIYDRDIARYRHNPKERVKQMFEEHEATPIEIPKRNNNSSRVIGEQIKDNSDEEDWDI